MTILTNPRHELYTQLRKACSRSMRTSRAGYERNFSHAARLAGAPDIKYRVSELQQRRVTVQDEAITMTVTQGLEELEAARVGAMEAGRSTTRLQPRVAKLKTAGLWVERSERATVKLEPSKLSDEELVARIAAAEQADRPQ